MPKTRTDGPDQLRGPSSPRGLGVPPLSATAPTGPVGGSSTLPRDVGHGSVLKALTVSSVLALGGIAGQATVWTALTKTALVAGGASVAILMGPTGAGIDYAHAGSPGPPGPPGVGPPGSPGSRGPSASTDEGDEADAIAIAIGSLGNFTDKATTLSFAGGTFEGEAAVGLGISHTFKGANIDVRIDIKGAYGVDHGQYGGGVAITFGW